MYQAYKHKREYYWYFIIMFLPFLGSMFYLFVEFGSRRNLEKVSSTIQDTVISDNRLKKLLKELEFSDTIKNRLAVGEEYMHLGQSEKALEYFESCLKGPHKDDIEILYKVLQANYEQRNFERVLEVAQLLKRDVNWQKSDERIAYAYALHATGKQEEAREEFEAMDVRYANYLQRLAYAEFLHDTGSKDAAKEKLNELLAEFDQMDRTEKRFKSDIIKRVRKAHSSI